MKLRTVEVEDISLCSFPGYIVCRVCKLKSIDKAIDMRKDCKHIKYKSIDIAQQLTTDIMANALQFKYLNII